MDLENSGYAGRVPSPSPVEMRKGLSPPSTQNQREMEEVPLKLADSLAHASSSIVSSGAADGGQSGNAVESTSSALPPASGGITSMGIKVLILLAVQNSSKNLIMRFVMKEKPKFLTSAAVIGSECIKLTLSMLYILFIEKKAFSTIVQFFREEWKNSLLVMVPASAYNLQTSLEYVALANLDAAMFSVLVQSKLLFTATFAAVVLRKKLKYIQVISLVLLTVGVMLCNLKNVQMKKTDSGYDSSTWKGIFATLGIAVSSGFASVYTEKVIKTQRAKKNQVAGQYFIFGIYASAISEYVIKITIGLYAVITDLSDIMDYGLFHGFNFGAFVTVLNSAIGGLVVANLPILY